MLEVFIGILCALGVYRLVWPILREFFWPKPLNIFIQQPSKPKKTTINREKVTVEDMVIHDMVNTDDTWDIGEVNFNE